MLRHDVDRDLDNALRMAELESCLGIRSTYYVRAVRRVFQPTALRRLHSLGHEVGYHYETLARAKGDRQRGLEMFERELARFRQVVPVRTVSMHGSPLSRWDNRDLWRSLDIGTCNLLGEAYLSIDFGDLYYFTDTGRCWDAGRTNLRDRAASRKPATKVHSTDDLIAFLQGGLDNPILINTHPNRWATNRWSWGLSAAQDWAVNNAKLMISWQRAHSLSQKAS
jgi:hypothetical protein